MEISFVPGNSILYYPYFNLLVHEHYDVFLWAIASRFGTWAYTIYLLGQLTIFSGGTFVLCRKMGQDSRTALLLGCLNTATVFAIFGPDPGMMKIHWFPVLLCSLFSLSKQTSLSAILIFGMSAVLWTLVAGNLAFLGAFVAIASVLVVQRQHSSDAINVSAWIMLLILSFMMIPPPIIGDYPPGARVAPISPFTFQAPPLLGPELSPNPLVFDRFQFVTANQAYLALLVLTCMALATFNGSSRRWRNGVLTIFAFIIIAFIDAHVTEYPLLSPFQAVRRLVPGVALFPLPVVLLVLVTSASLPFIIEIGPATRRRVLFTSLLFLCFGAFRVRSASPEEWVPHLVNAGSIDAYDTPSGYLLTTFGSWAETPRTENQFEQIDLPSSSVTISSFPNPEKSEKARDDFPQSIWQTGRSQRPGDFLQLNFDRQIKVLRVELNTGAHVEDFPRGIKVEGSVDQKEFYQIVHYPDWPGVFRWTAAGLPYFGPQSEVVIDFPVEQTVTALKFTQTAADPIYDWSVAEVKLFGKK